MHNITSETYLHTIIEREKCGPHQAQRGTPCWILIGSNGYFLKGVCNRRAKSAGFNHPVSHKSMQTYRSPKKK